MGIADTMKNLTEDIMGSYNLRVKALSDLVVDTHETLKGFATDRKKMAAELAKSLAKFVKDLTDGVEDMLKGFRKTHKEMGEEQAKNLGDFVTDLVKGVGNMIKGFQKEHKEMADNLKESLEKGETDRLKGETDRLKDFKAMMGDINKGIKDIETYVKNKLKEFSDAHADMSEELKKELAKYVGDIVSGVKRFLGEYGSDMAKAKAAWQGMVASLSKSRKGGVMSKIEAGEKVTTVEEVVEKKPKKVTTKVTTVEEAVEKKPKKKKGGKKNKQYSPFTF